MGINGVERLRSWGDYCNRRTMLSSERLGAVGACP